MSTCNWSIPCCIEGSCVNTRKAVTDLDHGARMTCNTHRVSVAAKVVSAPCTARAGEHINKPRPSAADGC